MNQPKETYSFDKKEKKQSRGKPMEKADMTYSIKTKVLFGRINLKGIIQVTERKYFDKGCLIYVPGSERHRRKTRFD